MARDNIKLQNILLLISSYFFYACWDWRFLFLLIFSTLLDYYTSLKIETSRSKYAKRKWLLLSVVINLGFLCFFKYYNFFIVSFSDTISNLGFYIHPWTLRIVLPVGISFYTFHGLSYIIDVYKERIKAERNLVDYSLFVSFFPLLVAGPIERATHLLPQIKHKREFDYVKAIDGLKQILWGLFKKIVIADQCAEYVNTIFDHYSSYSGSTLLLGAVLFSFQIYGDFSGYSDIALGTARLFGFELLKNFSFPYFSRNIAEFWRRWHISLSSWFRDYLYIPLGGSKNGNWMKTRNTLIIFLVSGFWHGANWTYIVWGLLNAIYILPSVLLNTNRNYLDIVAKGRYFPSISELLSILMTFFLTTLAWVFFRSESVEDGISYIGRIFSSSLFMQPIAISKLLILMLVIFFIIEWIGRDRQFAIAGLGLKWPKALRWGMYYIIILFIFYFSGSEQQFIYFQF